MNWWSVFPFVCGYECVGDQVRLYVDGPTPTPSFDRRQGVRTSLFRLYSGQDAESILMWLAQNRAWQVLRVPPPFTSEPGVRAILAASEWHGGEGSALALLARTRMIVSDDHRHRLQREVSLLIGSVLENPVRDGEFQELQGIEDVINAAPTGVELASTSEVMNAYFGSAG
jgi:hypothetical protein